MVCSVYSYVLKGERNIFGMHDSINVMFFSFFCRVYALWMNRSAEGGRVRSESGERRYMGH
jgi:hypothetical protein